MKRRRLSGLLISWECRGLPFDPIEPALPLPLDAGDLAPGAAEAASAEAQSAGGDREEAVRPDITIRATLAPEPFADPVQQGAVPVLYHGQTRCSLDNDGLVVWDGASVLRIALDGRRIEAMVHASSLQSLFIFTSVTVTMALLLALRLHGRFHLHAAAARLPGGESWVIAGDSNCGKSTLALGLFQEGAQWIGDDVLLLHSAGSEVEAAGWARRVRMTEKTSRAFPALAPLLTRCREQGLRPWEIDPRRAFPGRGLLAVRTPVTLILPEVGAQPSSAVQPLDRAEALGRTLHACAWVASEHLPYRQEQLDLLGRLVDRARCFEVSLGERLLQEPSAELARIAALTRAQGAGVRR